MSRIDELEEAQDGPLLLHSGRIFTGSALHPSATAVLVVAGRIHSVGTNEELLKLIDSDTKIIDVHGGLITPGFIDAHIHPVYGGMERNACDLTTADSHAGTLETIRSYVEQRRTSEASSAEWIFGGGWYTGFFPSSGPTAKELDAVTANLPAYLISADHHSAWINTAAMELAGINADTLDPDDGVIERDESGAPTGLLHEGAMDLLSSVLPPHSAEDYSAGLTAARDYLHSVGVTGWQDAILGTYAGYPDVSETYRRARLAGEIGDTVTGALWVPRELTLEDIPCLIEEFVQRRQLNAEAGFTTNTAKIMVDGVPENKTAAMLDDYCRCDALGMGRNPAAGERDRGLTYLGRDVLMAVSVALDAAGFDLHFHAIGDRAVRWALDVIEETRLRNPATAQRHHIAHIQIVHPDDVQRFARVGATANIQALWAAYDPQMIEHTIPQLGTKRASWQYPFSSIRRNGGKLCMGSDWPVSSADPWQAIHVAVNRTFPHVLDQEAALNEPLEPSEALDLTTALEAYTSGSAWQLRLDQDYGCIAPGAMANITVANRNPFDDVASGQASMICTTRNVLTIESGRIVYDAR